MEINGLKARDLLIDKTKQELAYNPNADFNVWRERLKQKLVELLGLDIIAQNACPLKFEIEHEKQKNGYKEIRFVFESEYGSAVPCYMLIPDTNKEKYPVAITLQGHSSGVHNSIGIPKVDNERFAMGRDAIAIQAVKEGYIALAIEQRAMGERRAMNADLRRVSLNPASGSCYYEQMTGLMLGRTLIGERCWDTSRAIDILQYFPMCDTSKIIITGNSGGGTAAYYASCCDERIKICAPSCSFCPFPESILRFYHCSCNYIPSAFRYFDMQDLACLIAPRQLLIIAGAYDPSFLIEGVERGFETVKNIYKQAGCEDNCRLIVTPYEHFWCEDIVWPEIRKEVEKLNTKQ